MLPHVVLLSGAEHLKKELEERRIPVFTSHKNYDGNRVFPNSDIYTRLGDLEEIISSDSVVIIQGGSFMLNGEQLHLSPADRVFETLQALDILCTPVISKEIAHKQYEYTPLKKPKTLKVFFTFFPFSLQDKVFQTGEAPSAKIVYNLFQPLVQNIAVVDLHAPPNIPWVQAGIKSKKLELLTMTDLLITEAIKRFELNHPLVLSPDEGGQIRTGTKGLTKSRRDSFTVDIRGHVNVKGREVILVDDFTKSGSTLIKAKEAFLQQGATQVIACVTHLMPLVDSKETKLEELITKLQGEIVASNTIPTRILSKFPKSLVSCLPLIEKYLKSTVTPSLR